MSDKARVLRHVHLAAQPVSVRTARFEGRDRVVVPIVALAEGVIQALGSDGPELVLASEFSIAPGGWNGRPVMNDHPMAGGEPISANEPALLESASYGQIFNTQVVGKKLAMEEWLDPVKAAALGGEPKAMLERSLAGAGTPVSVGVSVYLEPTAGVWNGKPYDGIWRNITPDHVANLPEGGRGACSAEMGCGTLRVARITDGGYEEVDVKAATGGAAGTGAAGGTGGAAATITEKPKRRTLRERFKDLFRAAVPGWSQSDVRDAVREALKMAEPLYDYIDDVWEEDGYVVYCVYAAVPGGMLAFDGPYPIEPYTTKTYKREFMIDERLATPVTLGERVEVEFVGEFKPVRAAGAPRAGACSCGGEQPATQPVTEGDAAMKTKAERIVALMAHPNNPMKDQKALEAASDENIAALEVASEALKAAAEAKAASDKAAADKAAADLKAAEDKKASDLKAAADAPGAPKTLTEAEILAASPEIADIVKRARAAEAAQKVELVGKLKAAQQAYTEAELSAMNVEQLTKLAVLAKVDAPKVDYSGRFAGGEQEQSFAPPDSYAPALEKMKAASSRVQ